MKSFGIIPSFNPLTDILQPYISDHTLWVVHFFPSLHTQGIQQGWQEVVSNMLNKNTDVDFISEVTGMPVKEIKKLKKKRF